MGNLWNGNVCYRKREKGLQNCQKYDEVKHVYVQSHANSFSVLGKNKYKIISNDTPLFYISQTLYPIEIINIFNPIHSVLLYLKNTI